MIDVAYGVPESLVSEKQLLEALALVAREFDESPTRMHAVLGPPRSGVRWFTFACSVFERGRTLAQDHFSEVMQGSLPALFIATRSYDSPPRSFEVRGERAKRFWLEVESARVVVRSGELPPSARRDGDVDEIALGALNLPIARPFVALAKPTHEVALRVDRRAPKTLAIEPYGGKILPCRVERRLQHPDPTRPSFALTPRATNGDATAATALFAQVSAEAERVWIAVFQGTHLHLARRLADAGPVLEPLLVASLAQAKPAARTAAVCLSALGFLRRAPEAVAPWALRGSKPHALAAFCALVSMGEVARPVVTALAASKRGPEREVGVALLRVLEGPEFAPAREVRAACEALPESVRETIRACLRPYPNAMEPGLRIETMKALYAEHGAAALLAFLRAAFTGGGDDWGRVVGTAFFCARGMPELAWAVGAMLTDTAVSVESGLGNYAARGALVSGGHGAWGEAMEPVARALASLPVFADDPVLEALASGRPAPTSNELRDREAAEYEARRTLRAKKARAKKDKARRDAAKKAPAAKTVTKKKPVAKKAPAAKRKPAAKATPRKR